MLLGIDGRETEKDRERGLITLLCRAAISLCANGPHQVDPQILAMMRREGERVTREVCVCACVCVLPQPASHRREGSPLLALVLLRVFSCQKGVRLSLRASGWLLASAIHDR